MRFTNYFILTAVSGLLAFACDKTQETDSTNDNQEKAHVEEPTESNGGHVLLKQLLDEKKQNFNDRASDEKKEAYAYGLEFVQNSGVLEDALNVGDKAPDFELMNQNGEMVHLYDILKDGPVILTWYRGDGALIAI